MFSLCASALFTAAGTFAICSLIHSWRELMQTLARPDIAHRSYGVSRGFFQVEDAERFKAMTLRA